MSKSTICFHLIVMFVVTIFFTFPQVLIMQIKTKKTTFSKSGNALPRNSYFKMFSQTTTTTTKTTTTTTTITITITITITTTTTTTTATTKTKTTTNRLENVTLSDTEREKHYPTF
jgi:hypothetical protein